MNATLAHPPERHLHGPDAARLTALLRRARRRLGLARLLHMLSLGVPAVAAALMALAWLAGRGVSSMAAAGLAATVAAGFIAWFGTPHAAGLAALLDRRLRLADRVGIALRVSSRTDAIALLIQRDAVTHLTPARIEAAFPLGIHRGTWLACAALTASAGLWLVERPAPEDGTRGPASAGGRAVQTSPRAGAFAARGPVPTAPENRAPEQTSPAAGTTPQPTPSARATEENAVAREGATQTGAPAPTAPEDRPATGRSAGTGDAGTREGAAPGNASPGRETARAGGSRDAREAAARGATDAAASTGRGAAGGVEYGRGLNGRATAARDVAGPPPSAAAIRKGQVRAETALAHDEVAPRYRAYLRDYFRAVQAMSEP